MRRLAIFLIILSLALSLAVPVLAVTSYVPSPPDNWNKEVFPYAILFKTSTGEFRFYLASSMPVISLTGSGYYSVTGFNSLDFYDPVNFSWEYLPFVDEFIVPTDGIILYSTHDLVHEGIYLAQADTSGYFDGVLIPDDGSSDVTEPSTEPSVPSTEPSTEPSVDSPSDETISDNGWNNDHSNTLWGWLAGIFDGIQSLGRTLVNLPQLIADKIGGFFVDLGTTILDGIKALFIPEDGWIESAFDNFFTELKMKFNLDWSMFESLFDYETPVTDVESDYSIPGVGSFRLKFLDVSFFIQGVAYFRLIIRGFLVLLLLFFHIKQFIGFFGYDAGVVQGRSDWISYNRANTGGHKE